MKRYFVNIQYNGSSFAGWQSQPNAPTVQDTIEKEMSKIFQEEIRIIGCGRTDSGVHALDFVFHFDTEKEVDESKIFKLNLMLPKSIAIQKIFEVIPDAHARFDASSRSYEYFIHQHKNPFNAGLSYYYPYLFTQDLHILNEVAQSLVKYNDFFAFCKTKSDVQTTICQLSNCKWELGKDQLVFRITANRFLRGMVRLIVGACINVATGKLSHQSIIHALKNRERLQKDLSVPAEGLYLNKIQYPATVHIKGSPSYNY